MFRLYPSEMVWMDRTYFIVIDYYISFPSFFLSFFFFFSWGGCRLRYIVSLGPGSLPTKSETLKPSRRK